MIKRVLAAAALGLLPVAVIAQPATAPVRVNVVGAVQLTSTGTTDFGPVPNQAQTKTINPAGPTGAQTTASFTATGSAGATIVVTYAPTVDLCHVTAGCGTRIVFTANLSAQNQAPQYQHTSTPIASDGTVVLNGAGEAYFYLGGSITVPANPTPGVHTGLFTLSAAYQ